MPCIFRWFARSKVSSASQKFSQRVEKLIVVPVASNTKVIGLGENSGIKGGSLLLKNVQNIAMRNMNTLDAFDPFPDVQKMTALMRNMTASA